MLSWKLTIEYEGTRYYGWQEQRNARTVAQKTARNADMPKGPESRAAR